MLFLDDSSAFCACFSDMSLKFVTTNHLILIQKFVKDKVSPFLVNSLRNNLENGNV